MRSRARTGGASPPHNSHDVEDAPPLPHAPWPQGLPSRIQRELDLDDLRATGARTADVVVVGGGVAGLSAALGAARASGARVLVLEAEPTLGRGATGRNAGILSAGINMGLADVAAGSPDAEMWPATTAELLALAARAAEPDALLLASLTGALSLAERPGAARHLAREAKARVAMGLRAEMWSPAQVAQATDGRLDTAALVAALWLPDEGRIHPLTLLADLAAQARAAGVTLTGGARVTSYEVAADRRWRLTLEDGSAIAARGLLQAIGPTHEPTARIYALAFRADLPDHFPLFWDAAPYTYCDFRPGQGRLTVSGGRYGKPGASGRDAKYHARLADAARHWLPELAGERPTHAWAVDLAVAADMAPGIRPLGQAAPGAAIEGLGALGVLPGIVLGRRAGAAIVWEIG